MNQKTKSSKAVKSSTEENLNIFKEYLEDLFPKGKENKQIIDLLRQFFESKSEKKAIDNFRFIYELLMKSRKDLFDDKIDSFVLDLAGNKKNSFNQPVNAQFVKLLLLHLGKKSIKVGFTEFYLYYRSLFLFGDPFLNFTEPEIESELTNFPAFQNSIYTIRGIIEIRKNYPENGINLLATALYEDSDCLPALLELADFYYNQQQYKIADKYLQKILEDYSDYKPLDDSKADLLFEQGNCAIKSKEYNRAINIFQKVIALDQSHSGVLNNLAYVLNKHGKSVEALKYVDKAIDIDLENENLYFNKIDILKHLGKYTDARETLGKLNQFSKAKKRIQKERESLKKWQEGNLHLKQNKAFGLEIENAADLCLQSGRELKMRDDRSLGKERFLEDIIEDRINKGFDTFSRKLKIFEDTFYGRQYPIPHGRIDLLCEDIDRKNLVVIELKKENSDHKVVEQIQTYVDYVKNNIAKSGQKVSGIICLSEASDDLKSAIGNYPNIEIFRYSFQLEHVKI